MSNTSEEVDRRIDIVVQQGNTHLNLSGLGLAEIPERVRLLTELVQLDLGYNLITELPAFIGEFRHLRNLILQGNRLSGLPSEFGNLASLSRLQLHSNRFTEVPEPLGRLQQLERLILGGNRIRTLPMFICDLPWLNVLDLYGNLLADLPPEIGRLTGLTELDLGSNRLNALPEAIGEFTGLTRIDLNGNRLRELPEAIGALHRLTLLEISGNRLATLPNAVGELDNLTYLDLRGNEFEVIPDGLLRSVRLAELDLSDNLLRRVPESIGELHGLLKLNLRGNRLTELPPSLTRLTELHTLVLDGNDLPPEIESASAQGAQAVLAYLREQSIGTVAVREAKLILVGEGGTGKSSLLAAIDDRPFLENRPLTHGLEVTRLKDLEDDTGKPLTLNAWDFGGQASSRPSHQLFFSAPAIYVIVWKPRTGAAQGSVADWVDLIRRRVGDGVRIHVVATHAETDDHLGDLDEAVLRRDHGDCIAGFHRIDSRTRLGIAGLTSALATTASRLPHLDRRIPARWLAFKEELDASGRSHMAAAAYLDRAQTHGLDADSARALAQVATTLGHWCHFPEVSGLDDLVVLKGDWLSRAVSLALNDIETRDRNGLVTHTRLARLWSDPRRPEAERYPTHVHSALIQLMYEFQIAYPVRDSRNGPSSLITRLVPTLEPDLQEWEQYGTGLPEQSYVIEFRGSGGDSVVPEGLMFELIAWFHRFTLERGSQGRGLHWASGMVLDHGRHGRALIRIDGGRMVVSVKAAYPTYLCKLIADDVCGHLKDWKGLTPSTLVPCVAVCAAKGRPQEGSMRFDLSVLQGLKAEGSDTAACARCHRLVSVDPLIGEYGAITASGSQSDREIAISIHKGFDEVKELLVVQSQLTRTHVTEESNLSTARADTRFKELTEQFFSLLADEGTKGPRLFTVERVRPAPSLKGLAQHRIRVVLHCEHSGKPVHELDGDPAKGVYTLDLPREWITKARPWLTLAARLLNLGADFLPAILKSDLEAGDWKAIENQVELAKVSAKTLASGASGLAESENGGQGFDGDSPFEEHTRGAIRFLHKTLETHDQGFAGLRPVRDRGRFLWVHGSFVHHYE